VSTSALSAAAIAWLADFVNDAEYSAKVWQTTINFEQAYARRIRKEMKKGRKTFLPSKASNSSTSTLSNMYPKNPHDLSTTDPQSSLFSACPLMYAN
jgi:hypothetical protein